MTLNYNEQREARRKALRLLEHMDRTEKGLRDRLIQGGFSEEAAEDAVEILKNQSNVPAVVFETALHGTRLDLDAEDTWQGTHRLHLPQHPENLPHGNECVPLGHRAP